MPTSGTHITILQRIAASSPVYGAVLGDPDPMLPATDPRAIKMRFASLGACGPDFLYALMDYGADLQDLENILIKIAGTFSGLAELLGGVQRYIDGALSSITLGVTDSLATTTKMITAVMNEGLYALLASGGVNPLAYFKPQRQKDKPITQWYWADVLHYWRTGTFAENLVRAAKKTGNANLIAYAYGYLTHYVTDVVGHPYVNQVVGGPWRLYWQRHHLVENFIDAYVWDRWHTPVAAAPGAPEPPLDRLVSTPMAMGSGAPATYARLNDHIKIGGATIGDPVDAIVDAVRAQLGTLLTNIGIAVNTEPAPPTDPDFMAWTDLIVGALKTTYDGYKPTNLATPFLLKGQKTTRPDGFPTSEDIAAAYGSFRLLMRVTTEESVFDPTPPSLTSDISTALNKIASDVTAALAGIPGAPSISAGGAYSPSAIVDALEKGFEWAVQVAAAVTKAAFDFIAATVAAGAVVVSDSIKYALWLVAKALYAVYRALRDVLTVRAYATPFGDQLAINLGGLPTTMLWQSLGDPVKPSPTAASIYPHEEIVEEGKVVASAYVPTDVPNTQPELPGIDFVAPYSPQRIRMPRAGSITVPSLPDAFIDQKRPGVPSDMFDPVNGPQAKIMVGGVPSFAATPKDYGPAIDNCKQALDVAMGAAPLVLPNYNLDADRTYGWPCWNVSPAPMVDPANPQNTIAPAPLAAENNSPSMIATVNATELL